MEQSGFNRGNLWINHNLQIVSWMPRRYEALLTDFNFLEGIRLSGLPTFKASDTRYDP